MDEKGSSSDNCFTNNFEREVAANSYNPKYAIDRGADKHLNYITVTTTFTFAVVRSHCNLQNHPSSHTPV